MKFKFLLPTQKKIPPKYVLSGKSVEYKMRWICANCNLWHASQNLRQNCAMVAKVLIAYES